MLTFKETLFLVALSATISASGAASAATFNVTTTQDNAAPCTANSCSLRAAIEASNNTVGANTVQIPAGDYILSLTNPQKQQIIPISIKKSPLSLVGAGAGKTTITQDNNALSAALIIDKNESNVLIKGITFDSMGLAIKEAGPHLGSLKIENSSFEKNNTSIYYNVTGGGSLDISTTVFQYNDVEGSGGVEKSSGVISIQGSPFTLRKVRLLYNDGGEIPDSILRVYNSKGSLSEVEFDTNLASSLGAFFCEGPESEVLVEKSLFRNNVANGIYADDAGILKADSGCRLEVENSTFSNNQVHQSNGGTVNATTGAEILLKNVTFADNASDGKGSAIRVGNQGIVRLKNTLVGKQNTVKACEASPNGSLVSLGYNLSADGSCNLNQAGDQNFKDPKLSPLTSHGGFTMVQPISATSPARNAADPQDFPEEDQRGYSRKSLLPDIGAYEFIISYKDFFQAPF